MTGLWDHIQKLLLLHYEMISLTLSSIIERCLHYKVILYTVVHMAYQNFYTPVFIKERWSLLLDQFLIHSTNKHIAFCLLIDSTKYDQHSLAKL
jgi:DNA modification methylase